MASMTADEILKLLHTELARPELTVDALGASTPRQVLGDDSLDYIEVVAVLEEKLGIELDLQRLGPVLAKGTFAELAAEVSRGLAPQGG